MPNPTKVAVVAGGSAGVGRATVTRLISNGFKVGVLARGQERLDQMSEHYGADVMCLSVDVSDADAVMQASAAIEEGLGPIRVWVNCAMLTSFSPFPKMEPAEFQGIVNTTLMGVVNGTRAALSVMTPRDSGRIVNVGSGLAYRSVPYQSAYCAAKHAINGFTSSVRCELLRDESRISISLIQLPAINTPQFDWARNRLEKKPQPAPPIFQPEVAARAVIRAVREGKREYFVGKSVLQLVFANMVLPAWMDGKLADSGATMQKSDQEEPGGRDDNLHAPVEEYESTARGRFSARANDTGIIVDADQMRKAVFFGIPALLLIIGLIIG